MRRAHPLLPALPQRAGEGRRPRARRKGDGRGGRKIRLRRFAGGASGGRQAFALCGRRAGRQVGAPDMTDDRNAPSSPACLAHEGGDAYMGFATRDELAAFLNELLEAERAGTGVALKSAQAADGTPYLELLQDVHWDEARWCAMLLRQLKALGPPATTRIGAFQHKPMPT